MSGTAYTIRECAQAIIGLIGKHGKDYRALETALRAPLGKLMARPDLLDHGVKREANHIDFSRHLYYDGELSITLDNFPKGKKIPPHDHGVWELLAIYRGQVEHTVYERLDDGSKPGYADLKVIEDRVLGTGDLSLVAQPAEIHSFSALTDDCFSVTVVGGNYAANRHYFNPAEKTYVQRVPKVRG
jgi:predicted metal-dependent enzyme (double-stranded beta helix superfamily)